MWLDNSNNTLFDYTFSYTLATIYKMSLKVNSVNIRNVASILEKEKVYK